MGKLSDLCDEIQNLVYDGENLDDRRELLMDFRDMLTEIKDVVTNHSGSNYVLSNIYLGGNLDNLADLPDNLRNTAFAEILGSNPDIDVRSALVERIDELVVDVSSIKFEDFTEDEFDRVSQAVSEVADGAREMDSVITDNPDWGTLEKNCSDMIVSKLDSADPEIKEQIADLCSKEGVSGIFRLDMDGEQGGILSEPDMAVRENGAFTDRFGVDQDGNFAAFPADGIDYQDLGVYIDCLNLLNGGPGPDAAIGDVNPFYISSDEKDSIIAMFVVKTDSDPDARAFDAPDNWVDAMKHFVECERHAFGFDVIDKDALKEKIDAFVDSDDFNGVDNDRADHNKDFFSPGVVNDKDVDNDQTDNDQQNKQDAGSDDTQQQNTGFNDKRDTRADQAERAGGYSIVWEKTGNEKIDKLIDKRNAYITNGGPFPLYRRDPRFTLLELRIVNGARSEGVKINGKVPDLRDCFIAYNNFRTTNVIEFGIMSLAFFIFDKVGHDDKDNVDKDKEPASKEDFQKTAENISQEEQNMEKEKAVDGLRDAVHNMAQADDPAFRSTKGDGGMFRNRDFIGSVKSVLRAYGESGPDVLRAAIKEIVKDLINEAATGDGKVDTKKTAELTSAFADIRGFRVGKEFIKVDLKGIVDEIVRENADKADQDEKNTDKADAEKNTESEKADKEEQQSKDASADNESQDPDSKVDAEKNPDKDADKNADGTEKNVDSENKEKADSSEEKKESADKKEEPQNDDSKVTREEKERDDKDPDAKDKADAEKDKSDQDKEEDFDKVEQEEKDDKDDDISDAVAAEDKDRTEKEDSDNKDKSDNDRDKTDNGHDVDRDDPDKDNSEKEDIEKDSDKADNEEESSDHDEEEDPDKVDDEEESADDDDDKESDKDPDKIDEEESSDQQEEDIEEQMDQADEEADPEDVQNGSVDEDESAEDDWKSFVDDENVGSDVFKEAFSALLEKDDKTDVAVAEASMDADSIEDTKEDKDTLETAEQEPDQTEGADIEQSEEEADRTETDQELSSADQEPESGNDLENVSTDPMDMDSNESDGVSEIQDPDDHGSDIKSAVDSAVSDPMYDSTDFFDQEIEVNGETVSLGEALSDYEAIRDEVVGALINDVADNSDLIMSDPEIAQQYSDLITNISDKTGDTDFPEFVRDRIEDSGNTDAMDAFDSISNMFDMQPDDTAVDSANEAAVSMAMDALEDDVLEDTSGVIDYGVDYAADHADDAAFDLDDFDSGMDRTELGVEPEKEEVDQGLDTGMENQGTDRDAAFDAAVEEAMGDPFEVYEPTQNDGFERTDWD